MTIRFNLQYYFLYCKKSNISNNFFLLILELPKITNTTYNTVWKNSKNIELVKQTIGHRKLDTSSAYVKKLSDQERYKRIEQLF